MTEVEKYGQTWEYAWDASNAGKTYYQSDIDYLLSSHKEDSLHYMAYMLSREVPALAIQLKKMGILDFDKSDSKCWEIINEHQDDFLSNIRVLLHNYRSDREDEPENEPEKSTPVKQASSKPKENKMSQTRRSVIVELFDDTPGLEAKHARVFSQEVVTELDDENRIIQQLFMVPGEDSVSSKLEKHNALRASILDEQILQNTGNEVKLRPARIEELRWNVKH